MLVFTYVNRFGVVTDRTVTNWVDRGDKFQGYCSTGNKVQTFLKKSVIAWLPASAAVLPAPREIPRPKPKEAVLDVCFTGFAAATKAQLVAAAKAAGMTVRPSPSVRLTYLVCGGNAGPAKVQAALDVGASILDEAGFRALI